MSFTSFHTTSLHLFAYFTQVERAQSTDLQPCWSPWSPERIKNLHHVSRLRWKREKSEKRKKTKEKGKYCSSLRSCVQHVLRPGELSIDRSSHRVYIFVR